MRRLAGLVRVSPLLLDGPREPAERRGGFLPVADVGNLVVGGVEPGERRSEESPDVADFGGSHRLDHLVARPPIGGAGSPGDAPSPTPNRRRRPPEYDR